MTESRLNRMARYKAEIIDAATRLINFEARGMASNADEMIERIKRCATLLAIDEAALKRKAHG
jgi:hypothetical protein